MNTFRCDRCGQTLSSKQSLENHLQRKIPCQPHLSNIGITDLIEKVKHKEYNDVTYDCEYCGRKFNATSNKSRHKKICKKRDKDVEELQKKVDELEKENAQLRLSVPSVNTINGNNNNNNNNNITTTNVVQNNIVNVNLRSFGCENLAAIPPEFVGDCFVFLKFRDLLENLHCDPHFPENNNIRIKSTKRGVLEIFRGDKWDLFTFTSGLNELLLQGQRIFRDYYRKNKSKILEEDMDESDLREILDQLEKIEELNEVDIKPLRQELQLMLEANRHQIQPSTN